MCSRLTGSLSKTQYLLFVNQEDKKLSQHDWKIVNWDIKGQYFETKELTPYESVI